MEIHETYSSGRTLLERGDRFRASGGPFYRTQDGTVVRMNDKGPFTFLRYCENGPTSWIEAWSREEGHCVLYVGPEQPSPTIEGYVRRPYRIKPIFDRSTIMSATSKKSASRKNRKGAAKTCPDSENAAVAIELETTAAAEPSTADEATQPAAEPTQPREKATKKSDGKMSAIDAAAKVLAESGTAMTTAEMILAMSLKGYWTSPGGKTPAATLYSSILREVATKGEQARFVKTERGHFALKV